MKRILLYTVCGLAMLTMFNSCHIYNKYHRPDVACSEILLRQAIPLRQIP